MTGHNTGAGAREGREIRRGTSNANERGNSEQRRRRREWLVETYPADVDGILVRYVGGPPEREDLREVQLWVPRDQSDYGFARLIGDLEEDRSSYEIVEPRVKLCRCARCGKLLTVDTVTCDRIFPGRSGGKYRSPRQDARELATNVRPHCGGCASKTGATGPRPNARRKATK
jgi:hypothetical protein